MANKEFILGLDIGSSSVRAALFDHTGKLLPKTLVRAERKLRSTLDGGSEIDADTAFRQVVKAVDDVLAKAPVGDVTHVAACTFWHSLLGVDADGKPTTPVLGWADNRSREHIETLRQRFDERETHGRTGARFHSSFWPAKLLWLRHASPEVWSRTAHWISIGDHIAARLSGELSTSISIASGTGIFNIRESTWDAPMLRSLKLKSTQLPRIAADAETFSLNRKFAKRWPRLADARWSPAVADGAANNIGSGCVEKDTAALMLGTSGAMRIAYSGEPPAVVPEGLWCYRVDHARSILGGALSDGGGLIDWLRQTLKLPANADKLIASRTPGAHGLTFLPFLAGERSTGYDENARGAVIGLTMAHDAVDILQAAMEAVALRFRDILEQLESVSRVDTIVASGGALRHSPVWTQMLADVLGREISLSDMPEASMRGAVLLALETIGKIQITAKRN